MKKGSKKKHKKGAVVKVTKKKVSGGKQSLPLF
jgi:hypothetical protein